MIITFSEYAHEGMNVELNEAYEPELITIQSEKFDIIEKSDVSIKLKAQSKEKIDLELTLELKAKASCDRCLSEVIVPLSVDYCEEIVVSETDNLDTYEAIEQEIILNWPMKILCKNDCKGLCLKCGLNLNNGSCDCDTFIPDPRMAAIKDIFESER